MTAPHLPLSTPLQIESHLASQLSHQNTNESFVAQNLYELLGISPNSNPFDTLRSSLSRLHHHLTFVVLAMLYRQ
jgi:hypothetical protein